MMVAGTLPKALGTGAGLGRESARLGRDPCPVASLPMEVSRGRHRRFLLLARVDDCTDQHTLD